MKFQFLGNITLSSMIYVFSLLLFSQALAQAKIEEIEQYEIRSYDPQKNGLTDLVFEARIEKLTEILNKTQTYGKLIDVYYKIYWMAPAQYKIEVIGLPKGFQEARDDLAELIKGKLEFVIPEKFSAKFKSYTLKSLPIADGKLVKAIDDSYTLAIPEMDIIFDTNGKLKTLETKASFAAIKTEFTQSPKTWSNNKLVMDKVVTVAKQPNMISTTTNTLEYTSVAGIGFPVKLNVKSVQEITIPANGKEKEKKVKNETGSVVKFTMFEVNTGKAQRFIVEGLRK